MFVTNARVKHGRLTATSSPSSRIIGICNCANCQIEASRAPLFKGKPKATGTYTTAQLEEMDMVGLYTVIPEGIGFTFDFRDTPGK